MFLASITTSDHDVLGMKYDEHTDALVLVYLTGPQADELPFPACDASRVAELIDEAASALSSIDDNEG